MGKYLKLFETDSERVEYEDSNDYIEPYVSYVEGDNTVHYNKFVETKLVVTYGVENASNPTQLYAYANQQGAPFTVLGADMFSKVEIDGTEVAVADLDTASGQTQFSVGEHTVKYTLIDPTFIGIEINDWTLTRLGAVFPQCSNIISVEIPNSVTNIGNSTFCGCSNLTSVTIPNSITSIGSLVSQGDEDIGAFEKCTSLTSITIPDSVTSIGDRAFSNCSSLTSITIPDSVTSIGYHAFDWCSGLTSVTIGSGITSIGTSVFNNCRSLTSVTIPDSVTSIGDGAIYRCDSLTSVTIPNSVTSIGDGAFQYCSGLTSVTIGSGITSISDYAFRYCSGLTSVTSLATTVPTLGVFAFYRNASGRKIYVPSESVEAYKAAANWSTYAADIEAIQ